MIFEVFYEFFENLIKEEKEKYVLSASAFTRSRKASFEDLVKYIFGNCGKSSNLELDHLFFIKNGDFSVSISKQNFSKQRSFISWLIFKDAVSMAVKELYSSMDPGLDTFKGFNVFAVDGSQVELPNTKQTCEEFNVPLRALKKTDTPKARVSLISDIKNEYIIDSTIDTIEIGEQPLAFQNIEKAAELIDLKKSIIVFDRLYASTELYMQLLEKQSHFIFRLQDEYYKKQRNQMKTNDEYIEIKLTNEKINRIKNKELQEKARKKTHLELRIVNVKLENGEIETLITNLPQKIANSEELKELYGERWQIENTYDILKNKIEIENFSGKREISIKQDFYAQILMYNMLISTKHELNQEIKEKIDSEYQYQVNLNQLIGKIKIYLFHMIFAKTQEERKMYETHIKEKAKKNLIKKEKKESKPRKKTKTKKYPYNNRKKF
jgi:hypothetical protein